METLFSGSINGERRLKNPYWHGFCLIFILLFYVPLVLCFIILRIPNFCILKLQHSTWHKLGMRNKILVAISVNKRYHSHRQLQPLPRVSQWALRGIRKETQNTSHLVAIRLQTLSMENPEETQTVKTQDTDPIAEAQIKTMTSVNADLCIFPYMRKH